MFIYILNIRNMSATLVIYILTLSQAFAINLTSDLDKPLPAVDIKNCRVANCHLQYNAFKGHIKLGRATKQLSHESQTSQATLLSTVRVSAGPLKFVQEEGSVLSQYDTLGFTTSTYTYKSKKPFKKFTRKEYAVNNLSPEKQSLLKTKTLLDPLAVYEHLRELVCSGLREDVNFKIKEDDGEQTYQFIYKGLQQLTLNKGTINTILLVRTRQNSSRETSIWFAIDKAFLPIKIVQKKRW